MFIDQLAHFFFTNILLDYFQPQILQEEKREELLGQGGNNAMDYLKTVRTSLQKFSLILDIMQERKMILAMFYFFFGARH